MNSILTYYSNLTVANHVFFLSPYLTKGLTAQQEFDSTMTQAIGRARRFGQDKTVHVYHFIASKTIDVDIIEKRSSKILKQVEFVQNIPPFKRFTEERIALVEPVGDEEGEFASSAASEIFKEGSEYA
jgi:superfamily II DNA or RNA helicase